MQMRKQIWIVMLLTTFFLGVCMPTVPCLGQEASENESIIYEYDELNRVVKATYPDGTVVTFEYDKNGNVSERLIIPPENSQTESSGMNSEVDVTNPSDTEADENVVSNEKEETESVNLTTNVENSNLTREDGRLQTEETEPGGAMNGNNDSITDESIEEEDKNKITLLPWILGALAVAGGIVWVVSRKNADTRKEEEE